jgi:hypothetical protein
MRALSHHCAHLATDLCDYPRGNPQEAAMLVITGPLWSREKSRSKG